MKTFVIDDDHLSIFLTQNMLKMADNTLDICTFLSSQEALDELLNAEASELPALILLDLNMPVVDGWELLDNLAPYAEKFFNRSHVYILTSSLDTSDIEKAKSNALVSGFLHKPIMIEDVEIILTEMALRERTQII